MKKVDLDAIRYLPAIRSRQAELKGYRELRVATKELLCPLVSVGKLGRLTDALQIGQKITEAIAGAFFLDLNMITNQQCEGWEQLCNGSNNFQSWREYAARVEGAVPVALVVEGVSERATTRQAILIEREHGLVVVRSRRPATDLPILRAILSAVDDVSNLLIVLDFGYIRASLDAREIEARRVISDLRLTDDSVRVVLMSSSFPRAFAAYGENGGTLEILERDLHARLGGDDVALHGDHASIHPDPFEQDATRFVPRVDYCTQSAWIYRRHGMRDGGYVRCARQVVALPEWDEDWAEVVWGGRAIIQTARQANDPPQGFGSPANWIAARVNMHIERQAGELYLHDQTPEDDSDGDIPWDDIGTEEQSSDTAA